MNILHRRFRDSLLTYLAEMRERRRRFHLLLQDWPTGIRVRTRAKRPEADLRRHYGRRFLVGCAGSAGLHLLAAFGLPEFRGGEFSAGMEPVVIAMEDIPKTQQIVRPPPPPRPAVPIATAENDVPDDVSIASTDLDLEDTPIDLPPPPFPGRLQDAPGEEPAVPFWTLEVMPQLVKRVLPDYPEIARRAGLAGTVLCRVLVGKDGTVQQVLVLKGDEIFSEAARQAIAQYVFRPAMQNDRPVAVWMVIPMHFSLSSG